MIAKIDAVKSKINVLTALMVVFLTALFAVIGYVFVHWREFNVVDVCIIFWLCIYIDCPILWMYMAIK